MVDLAGWVHDADEDEASADEWPQLDIVIIMCDAVEEDGNGSGDAHENHQGHSPFWQRHADKVGVAPY